MENYRYNMRETILPEILVKPVLRIDVLSSLYHYHYTPNYVFSGEFHSAWELVYVDLGEVVVTAEDKDHIVSAQQFFLHKPDGFHKIRANHQNSSVLVCAFKPSVGQKALLTLCSKVNCTTDSQRLWLAEILKEVHSTPAFTNFRIEEILKLNQFGSSLQFIENCLENFFFSSLFSSGHYNSHNMEGSNAITCNVVQYLDQHLSEHITVDDIAKALGYSASYLSKVFVRLTKKSIITVLSEMRIQRAKEMIATGTQTLSEISESLGFSSLQYFSTMFKKVTGFSPTEYKKALDIHQRYDFDWL